jgi:hypothetical protein
MQFGVTQREQLRRNWYGESWFYTNLGSPARTLIEAAYGIINVPQVTPKQRAQAQEMVTTSLSIFAHRTGCDKSHVVHALLSGSIEGLQRALERTGNASSELELRVIWESCFRDVALGNV